MESMFLDVAVKIKFVKLKKQRENANTSSLY